MRGTYLITVLILLFLLAGCATDDGGTAEKDALGRPVPVPPRVERVVSLAPSVTEILFAAGAGPRLVGVSNVDNYPPVVAQLSRYSILPVDFEAVTALQPDLAFATDQVNSPRDAETLTSLGIPVYFLPARSLEDVFASIETAARLLGTQEAGHRAVDSLRGRVAELQARTKAITRRPLVLFLISDETLYAFGSESYIHEIIALAGGTSATAPIEQERPVLSDEFVLATNPDVIVGTFGPNYDSARLLENHPTWSSLKAIRDGRVFSMDPDITQRAGPRLIEAAWQLAHRLHPEALR